MKTQEIYGFKVIEEITDDPLKMEFKQDVQALTNPDLKYPINNIYLEESRQVSEEALEKEMHPGLLKVEDESEYVIELLCGTSNDDQSQTEMVEELKKEDSVCEDDVYESENESIGRVGYMCEICYCAYETEDELINHISKQHQSEVFCVDCSTNFDTPNELRIHKQLVHETDSPVQCEYCNEGILIPRNELVDHFQCKHKSEYLKYFPPTSYKCKYCRNIYSTPFELEGHVKAHVIFKCTLCNISYGNLSSYNVHIKQNHSSLMVKQLPDNISLMAFSSDYVQKEHEESQVQMQNNTKIKRNRMETTENIYHKNQYTKSNQEQQESSEIYAEENSDIPKLKAKKRHLCSFCPRVLSSRLSLELHEKKQHLNIKTDVKECPICKKEFSSDYVKKHIQIVHIGERKFTCDICGDSYKTHDTVKRHRLLHMKDRNFPCTVCDRSFAEKSEFKVHMRIHTGELPFDCHLCDRRFRIKAHLTYHLQQHANIKKKCNECGKEFKNSKSLRDHSFLHTGIMPYTCPICEYGSAKREVLAKHMLRKHDITMTADELFAMFKANTGRSPRVKLAEELEMMNKNM
ncbi:oocyte zinc finger protein XlCOF6-like [Anastrepha obliqua]|uniref:oocyte zinc finger protein XlCOF6-like n=1 Tax=Anastrepha obliqua TaxID=95512 RepID=UPI00240A6798|nr:oocyte zinc finger protein XlCOF6-like [Anastrepha obliqua]